MAIISQLYASPADEFYLRELVRLTGFAPRSIQVQLERLLSAGLIADRRDGNRRYFRAERSHNLFAPLRDIALGSVGPAAIVREGLGAEGVELALIFGSLAAGTAKRESDVDLLVIGNASLRSVVRRLQPIQERLGREINPVVWTRDELAERRRGRDRFLLRIMAEPKMMVRGTEDEFGRLGP